MKTYGSEKTSLDLTKVARSVYSESDPLTITEIEREDGTLRYNLSGIIERDDLTADEVNAALEALAEPETAPTLTGCMITFMAGEGRHFHGGVNYLISDDRKIYAECQVQEGCSEDYGYLTMKKAIQDKTGGAVGYTFWYDGQEEHLEADASAECEVYVEID